MFILILTIFIILKQKGKSLLKKNETLVVNVNNPRQYRAND